jgi:hypothetical protein
MFTAILYQRTFVNAPGAPRVLGGSKISNAAIDRLIDGTLLVLGQGKSIVSPSAGDGQQQCGKSQDGRYPQKPATGAQTWCHRH